MDEQTDTKDVETAYRLNRLWDVADTLIGDSDAAEDHRTMLRNRVRGTKEEQTMTDTETAQP